MAGDWLDADRHRRPRCGRRRAVAGRRSTTCSSITAASSLHQRVRRLGHALRAEPDRGLRRSRRPLLRPRRRTDAPRLARLLDLVRRKRRLAADLQSLDQPAGQPRVFHQPLRRRDVVLHTAQRERHLVRVQNPVRRAPVPVSRLADASGFSTSRVPLVQLRPLRRRSSAASRSPRGWRRPRSRSSARGCARRSRTASAAAPGGPVPSRSRRRYSQIGQRRVPCTSVK